MNKLSIKFYILIQKKNTYLIISLFLFKFLKNVEIHLLKYLMIII
jgi:hypothetical protein